MRILFGYSLLSSLSITIISIFPSSSSWFFPLYNMKWFRGNGVPLLRIEGMCVSERSCDWSYFALGIRLWVFFSFLLEAIVNAEKKFFDFGSLDAIDAVHSVHFVFFSPQSGNIETKWREEEFKITRTCLMKGRTAVLQQIKTNWFHIFIKTCSVVFFIISFSFFWLLWFMTRLRWYATIPNPNWTLSRYRMLNRRPSLIGLWFADFPYYSHTNSGSPKCSILWSLCVKW